MSNPLETLEQNKNAALIELRISRYKKQIDDLLVLHYSESQKDQDSLWSLRVSQAQLALRCCTEIVKYVSEESPAAANELEMRVHDVSTSLLDAALLSDLQALEDWYKKQLAPLLNKAEQLAHLVATTRRKALGDGEGPFAWNVGEPPGGEEHIRRFGKTAQEFKYLDKTCPICGGNLDEMGWCGCGTIGGG